MKKCTNILVDQKRLVWYNKIIKKTCNNINLRRMYYYENDIPLVWL